MTIKLSEFLSFDHDTAVANSIKKKHGHDVYEHGTFGIEIEFSTSPSDDEFVETALDRMSSYEIMKLAEHNRAFDNNYDSWVDDRRETINSRYVNRGWDDSYGPPTEEQWVEMNPKPDDEIDGSAAVFDWEQNANAAGREYNQWERRDKVDYKEEYVSELGADVMNFIEIDDLRNYYDRHYNQARAGIDSEENIDAINRVTTWLERAGEKLNNEGTGTKDSWNVGMDGSNIEIRSRHLMLKDIEIVQKLIQFVQQNYRVDGNNSAHVHIGVPSDFTPFNLFVMTTLVDEKAVKQSMSKGRREEFESWAALREEVVKKLDKILSQNSEKYLGTDRNSLADMRGRRFKIDKEKFSDLIKTLAHKMTGTNIESFYRHGTVEFRYFSADMEDPTSFVSWIRYFMLLPVVAKKRNHARLGRYEFIQTSDYIIVSVK